MTIENPSPTAPDGGGGRDAKGRFSQGNKLAKGNPYAKKVAELRDALLRAVRPCDVGAVIRKLLDLAKSGDVAAAKLLLERTLGPPIPIDVLERLEKLESLLREEEKRDES